MDEGACVNPELHPARGLREPAGFAVWNAIAGTCGITTMQSSGRVE